MNRRTGLARVETVFAAIAITAATIGVTGLVFGVAALSGLSPEGIAAVVATVLPVVAVAVMTTVVIRNFLSAPILPSANRQRPRSLRRVKSPFARFRRRHGPDSGAGAPRASVWTHRLVDYLLRSALLQIPEDLRDRYAEEWTDHRTHLSGWRLLWWALCLRATASRTGREYRRVRLPRNGG